MTFKSLSKIDLQGCMHHIYNIWTNSKHIWLALLSIIHLHGPFKMKHNQHRQVDSHLQAFCYVLLVICYESRTAKSWVMWNQGRRRKKTTDGFQTSNYHLKVCDDNFFENFTWINLFSASLWGIYSKIISVINY